MRLTPFQVDTVKSTVGRIVGHSARVWLFGSRTDDQARGGDIDLFVQTEERLPNRVASACRVVAELQQQLGDQRIDVVLADAATPPQPIHQIARETGIML
jgi:predicted nucleotidyltransferase